MTRQDFNLLTEFTSFLAFIVGSPLFKISSIIKVFVVGAFTSPSVLLNTDDLRQVPKVLKQRSRLQVVLNHFYHPNAT